MYKIFDDNVVLANVGGQGSKTLELDNTERGNTLIIEVFDAVSSLSDTVVEDAKINFCVYGQTKWKPQELDFINIKMSALIYANPWSLSEDAKEAGTNGDLFAQTNGQFDFHLIARGTTQPGKGPGTFLILGADAFDKITISLNGGNNVNGPKIYMHVSLGIE